MGPRSLAGTADHMGNAAAAASSAKRVSAAPPSGTEPTTCPVAGSRTSNSAPPPAPIHSPLTYMRLRVPIDGLLGPARDAPTAPNLKVHPSPTLDAPRQDFDATGGPCQRHGRRIDSAAPDTRSYVEPFRSRGGRP